MLTILFFPPPFAPPHPITQPTTDTGTDATIPLPNVSSKILAKVIEYCKYHVQAKKSETSEDETKTFDTEFVKVDQATLFELILVRDVVSFSPPPFPPPFPPRPRLVLLNG